MAFLTTNQKVRSNLISENNVLTPEFRVSFPDVFTAKAFGGGEPKFQVVMLFPKEQDLTPIKDLIRGVVAAAWPNKDSRPPLEIPSFKVSDKEYDGYEDHVAIRVSSQYPPGVVDVNRTDIINQADFYAGCYARAQINAYSWKFGNKEGVSLGLQNVQKLRDGDPFGNRADASAAFDDGYTAPAGFEGDGGGDIFSEPPGSDSGMEFDDSDIPF